MKKRLSWILGLLFLPVLQGWSLAPCVALDSTNLPYFEDFQSTPDNTIPECWSRIVPSDGESCVAVLGTNIYGGGDHYLRIWSSSDPNTCVFAIGPTILPEILPHVYMTLQLDLNAAYGIAPIDVGVMTDPTDTSTFILVRRIEGTEFNPQGWYIEWADNFRVWFDSIQVGGTEPVYIAFRDYGKHHLDNIWIDFSPSCYPPEHLHAGNTTGSSAELSWDDVAENYYVYFWNDPTAAIDSVAATLDANGTFTLTGLEQQKSYQWYVSSVCEDSTLSSSFISSFSTPCGPITAQDMPYIQDFESVGNNLLPSCWTRTSSTYNTSLNVFPGVVVMDITYDATHTSHRCLKFHNDAYYGEGIAASQMFNLDLSQLGLHFLLESVEVSGGYFDVGVMTNPNDPSTFTLVKRIERTDIPYNLFVHQYIWLGNVPITDSNVCFAFRAVGNWNLDNLELIHTDECVIPDSLSVLSVDTGLISIEWSHAPNTVAWVLASKTNNETLWTNRTVSVPFLTMMGLQPATTYYLKVRSMCPGDFYSDWSDVVSVTTDSLPNNGNNDDDGIIEYPSMGIRLFPNPTKEYLNIQCVMDDVRCENVEVYDVYGKVVHTVVGANHDLSIQIRINISNLSAGIYFVRVNTDQGSVTKRFVKQ